jgi:hypothetical protein
LPSRSKYLVITLLYDGKSLKNLLLNLKKEELAIHKINLYKNISYITMGNPQETKRIKKLN